MGIAAVVLSAGGIAVAAVPGLGATACPRCYDLTSLGNRLYADRDDPAYRTLIDDADRRIAAFYGARLSEPRVLICSTASCYDRLGGGGEKGRALRNWSLMLSPAGINPTIATHELSHVEFHERLGSASGKVPQWFDEGLAVLVSDDARYLRPASQSDRCKLPYDEARPVIDADWWTAAADGVDRPYLQAGCVVSRWAGANGGPAAVLDLITKLRAGADWPADQFA
ncbi:hypothetical protein [Paractinoplanes durhamensis]|uniref:Uncharacterized protein n=1 Tax=Paractinoplanes durhamensis TaxID=113563 RepID=A0ABQ3YRH5_9ACTN|nr:hypothetical protein [Actinoplanes durhamensis]GIE00191.1 hypothetical protein Adu01nite_15410 [Actinoplanes durhamensis]